MRQSYIVEAASTDGITIYRKSTYDAAVNFAQMLRDLYFVDVDIFTEAEYADLHPNWCPLSFDDEVLRSYGL